MKTHYPIVIPKKDAGTEPKKWSIRRIKQWNFRKVLIKSCLAVMGLAGLLVAVLWIMYQRQREEHVYQSAVRAFHYFRSVKLPPDLVADAYAGKPTFKWKVDGHHAHFLAYLVLMKTLSLRQVERMRRDRGKGGLPYTDLSEQQRKLARWLILYVRPGDPQFVSHLFATKQHNWEGYHLGVELPSGIEEGFH